MKAVVLVAIFFSTVCTANAFDYGPVGNGIFWAVLGLWSMAVAYVLLAKRQALWGSIATFAHALLSPGVRPQRLPRNPHIVAETVQSVQHLHHTRHHVVGTAGKPDIGAVALAHSQYAQVAHAPETPLAPAPLPHAVAQPVVQPPHQATSSAAAQVLPAPTSKTVVHSIHMTPTHATPPPAPQAPATVHTKDTLTLEIIAGVPKLILKREKK